MANVLKTEKQVMVIGALAEGNSIRSIERMTGVHRDTIMRLGVRVGNACREMMDSVLKNLSCKVLQFDEIWGFIGKKQKNVNPKDDSRKVGDVWTFVAIDAETKLVPAFRCGKRDLETASAFVKDVSSRLMNRVQVSTDALTAYVEAVEQGFGGEVDYGQIVKTYSTGDIPAGKYSPAKLACVDKTIMIGEPDAAKISTSFVERQNLTMRMHMRRLTRLTNAFSKKIENFRAAAALHFAYYNFVKNHKTLRCTPAMAAGVEKDFWTVADLVRLTA